MKYSKKTETKKEEKEKFDLQECFTLWLHKGKKGKKGKKGVKYLSGNTHDGNKLVGFFNKKDKEEQSSVRIYDLKEDGSTGEEIVTLWEHKSTKGNDYLSGTTNEKESIIAFYGDEHQEKRPYIRGYFKKD